MATKMEPIDLEGVLKLITSLLFIVKK